MLDRAIQNHLGRRLRAMYGEIEARDANRLPAEQKPPSPRLPARPTPGERKPETT